MCAGMIGRSTRIIVLITRKMFGSASGIMKCGWNAGESSGKNPGPIYWGVPARVPNRFSPIITWRV